LLVQCLEKFRLIERCRQRSLAEGSETCTQVVLYQRLYASHTIHFRHRSANHHKRHKQHRIKYERNLGMPIMCIVLFLSECRELVHE
jgi:hypothetical protein